MKLLLKIVFMKSSIIFVVLYLCSCNPTKNPDIIDPGNDTIPTPSLPSLPTVVFSECVSDSFTLYLRLPKKYNHNKEGGYPVLYILDAEGLFSPESPSTERIGACAEMLDTLTQDGYVPETIAIGIENIGHWRFRDYYYPPDTMYTEYGHAENFYAFLESELIPMVDSLLNTKKSEGRTIYGHSASGYFVLYAAFQYNEQKGVVFNNFLASSPRVNHYDFNLLGLARDCFNRNSQLPQKIFGGFGTGPGELLREEVKKFSDGVKAYPFDFKVELFSDQSHGAVYVPSFYSGMMWFYGFDYINLFD